MNQQYIEKVAGQIIEQLEQGTAPWQKPWSAGELRAPFNPVSGKDYRGFNNVWLQMQGFSDPRWMTFNQAGDEGARVKKGSKGTQIVFWQFTEERDATDSAGNPILADGKPTKITVQLERPKSFNFTVFNAEQIDGLPPLELKSIAPEPERVARAENILASSGARIKHQQGDRAFYSPIIDGIVLPLREQFSSPEAYYATAFHELGHWTGHSDRLNRDLDHPFGTIQYAREELRAEIASLMLAQNLDIPHDPGQHASYVASWIKVLQDDPREIFRAAADAERIVGHIVDIEQALETAKSQEQTQMRSDINISHAMEDESRAVRSSMWQFDQTTTIERIPQIDPARYADFSSQRFRDLSSKEDRVKLFGYKLMNTIGLKTISEELDDVPEAYESQYKAGYSLEDIPLSCSDDQQALKWYIAGLNQKDLQVQFQVRPPVDMDATYLRLKQLRIQGAELSSEKNFHLLYNIATSSDELASYQQSLISAQVTIDSMSIETEEEEFEVFKLQVGIDNQYQELSECMGLLAIPLGNDILADKNFSLDQYNIGLSTGIEKRKEEDNSLCKEFYVEDNELAKAVRNDRLARIRPAMQRADEIRYNMREIEAERSRLLSAAEADSSKNAAPPSLQKPDVEVIIPVTTTVLHQGQTHSTTDRVYLAVPYAEKDEAKAAAKAAGFGLQWDKEAKAWSAPADADLSTMAKWRADGPRVVAPSILKSHEEQFAEALRAEGLILQGAPIMDGEMHRVAVEGDRGGQTGGAYVGHINGQMPAGYIQNFRTGAQINWKADSAVDLLSPDERARLNAEAALQRDARARERQALHEQTSVAASALWNVAPLADVNNPYCKAKGITNPSASGLRVVPNEVSTETEALGIRIAKSVQEAKTLRSADAANRVFMAGDLLIPGFDEEGRLWTLQGVNPYFKSLMKNGRKCGLMTVAGAADIHSALNSDQSRPLIVAEGFATASSVAHLTGQPVIVAFDSGNLAPVCESLRERYPSRPLFIAADNDHKAERERDAQGQPKPNVGLEKAQSAAEKFGGGVITPDFSKEDKGSDWNDYLAEKGEEATKRHFAEQMAAARVQATLAAQKIASLADEHLADLQNDSGVSKDDEAIAKARSENAHALVFASAQLDEVYGKTAQALAMERATETAPSSSIDAIEAGLDRLETGVKTERSHIAGKEEQFAAAKTGNEDRVAVTPKAKTSSRASDLGAGY